MAAAPLLKVPLIPEENEKEVSREEESKEEEERKRAREMIGNSIHLTTVHPPSEKIEIKKKKRWWQIWK